MKNVPHKIVFILVFKIRFYVYCSENKESFIDLPTFLRIFEIRISILN